MAHGFKFLAGTRARRVQGGGYTTTRLKASSSPVVMVNLAEMAAHEYHKSITTW